MTKSYIIPHVSNNYRGGKYKLWRLFVPSGYVKIIRITQKPHNIILFLLFIYTYRTLRVIMVYTVFSTRLQQIVLAFGRFQLQSYCYTRVKNIIIDTLLLNLLHSVMLQKNVLFNLTTNIILCVPTTFIYIFPL